MEAIDQSGHAFSLVMHSHMAGDIYASVGRAMEAYSSLLCLSGDNRRKLALW